MLQFRKLLGLLLVIIIILVNPFASFSDDASISGDGASEDNIPQALQVHFIDVGQADSILIHTPDDKSMLIDAGTNETSKIVVNYIRNLGIKKLDYLIATHPHEDHIGGMDSVIKSFDIGGIYMPDAAYSTKSFSDVLKAVKSKKLYISRPEPGTEFNLGEAVFKVLAPNSGSYEEINDYSIVLGMQYGNTSFLFAGDAQGVSEKEMLAGGRDISANVLKIGHHGSTTSTTVEFLNAVGPQYAVISCGQYNNPAKQTLDRLKARGILVYRTNESGSIICSTDGNNITFNVNPGSYTPGQKQAKK